MNHRDRGAFRWWCRRKSPSAGRRRAARARAGGGASLSTVAVQVFAEAKMQFTIPAAAFTPPPRVDSALVRLEVRDRPAVEVDDLQSFFRFVEAVFPGRPQQLGGKLGL